MKTLVSCIVMMGMVNLADAQNLQTGGSSPNPLVQSMVDAVSPDSLASYIGTLQAFGTRFEYTPQRDSAAAYLEHTLSTFGVAAESDWYVFGMIALHDLAIVSNDSIWAAGSSGTLVATTDAGLTWTPQVSTAGGNYYGIEFSDRLNGWAVGEGGTIVHTTDAGSIWAQQTSNVNGTLYDVDFANNQLGIAVGDGVLLRTVDGGSTWSQVISQTGVLRKLEVLDPGNMRAVGAGGNILYSSDGGLTWLPQPSGVSTYLRDVAFVSTQIGWVVGDGPTVLKTIDGGKSWDQLIPPHIRGTFLRSISFQDTLRGYMVSPTGEVFRSTDGGETWAMIIDHLNLGWGPSLYTIGATADGLILYCGTRGTLSASRDDGATWISLTPNLPSWYLSTSRNIVGTIKGQTTPEKECLIVAHYDSYSSDPFLSAPGANDNASGTSALMEAARICAGYTFSSTVRFIAVSAEEYGMYGSTDYAMRARKQNRQIAAVINGDMLGYPVTGDTARLIIGSYVIRNRLIDSGLTYNGRYGLGLTLVPIVDLTGASDYGPFAAAGYDALEVAEGTPDEIWGGADPYYHKPTDTMDKLNLGMVRSGAQLMLATLAELAMPLEKVSSATNDRIPERFALHQNYPNPFNPNTTIEYQLRQWADVSLRVFNILGQEVAVLVDEVQQSGFKSVDFNASGLPSGVYLYRLTAGEFVATKKFILLK